MFGIPFHMFIRKMCCPDGVQGEKKKTDPEPMKKHEKTDPEPMKKHEMRVFLDPGAIRIRELY
jgi:hypothetical protein